MTYWNEAEHPRDDIGRFTDKGGGSSTKKQESYEEKMERRADILYGSDEEYYKKYPHKNNGNITGAAADISSYNKQYIEKLQNMAQADADKSFLNALNHILEAEGGYNNIVGDVPTNLGVTQDIYNNLQERKRIIGSKCKKYKN